MALSGLGTFAGTLFLVAWGEYAGQPGRQNEKCQD